MAASPLTPAAVLAAVPHRAPFRFIDEILELDDAHIVAAYRFQPEAEFYRGHFPGNPITPGVLLVEAMAQACVVAHGIYLLGGDPGMMTLFTEPGDFFRVVGRSKAVPPGRKTFLPLAFAPRFPLSTNSINIRLALSRRRLAMVRICVAIFAGSVTL